MMRGASSSKERGASSCATRGRNPSRAHTISAYGAGNGSPSSVAQDSRVNWGLKTNA